MTVDQIKSQRTIAERAGIRWPSMPPRTMRWVLRQPPGSRARRLMLQRVAQVAFLAWNRGDYALIPYIIDDPEVETHIALAPLDADPVYYGPEGHCRAMEVWNDAWREWGGHIEEVIDEGPNRAMIVARVYGEGAASGIKLDAWGAVRYTFRDGRILRVDAALDPDRDCALHALGAVEPE